MIDETIITRLQNNDPTLANLDYESEKLTLEEVQELVNVLKDNKHVTTIDFGDTSYPGFENHLVQLLGYNVITKLYVDSINPGSEEKLQELSTAFKDNTSLKYLGITNEIKAENAEILKRIFISRKTFIKIDLQDSLSNNVTPIFTSLMKENHHILIDECLLDILSICSIRNIDSDLPTNTHKLEFLKQHIKEIPRLLNYISHGKNLLMIAIAEQNFEAAEYLLSAYPHMRNSDSQTALHVVCNKRNADSKMIDLLLNAGIDVNAKNENGETVLDLAIERGDIDTVKKLLNSQDASRENTIFSINIVSTTIAHLNSKLTNAHKTILDNRRLPNNQQQALPSLWIKTDKFVEIAKIFMDYFYSHMREQSLETQFLSTTTIIQFIVLNNPQKSADYFIKKQSPLIAIKKNAELTDKLIMNGIVCSFESINFTRVKHLIEKYGIPTGLIDQINLTNSIQKEVIDALQKIFNEYKITSCETIYRETYEELREVYARNADLGAVKFGKEEIEAQIKAITTLPSVEMLVGNILNHPDKHSEVAAIIFQDADATNNIIKNFGKYILERAQKTNVNSFIKILQDPQIRADYLHRTHSTLLQESDMNRYLIGQMQKENEQKDAKIVKLENESQKMQKELGEMKNQLSELLDIVSKLAPQKQMHKREQEEDLKTDNKRPNLGVSR